MGLSLPSFPAVLAPLQTICGILTSALWERMEIILYHPQLSETSPALMTISGLSRVFFSLQRRLLFSYHSAQVASGAPHMLGSRKVAEARISAHSHRRWKPHCRSRRGGWLPVVSFYCVYRAKGSSQSTPSAHSSPTSPVWDPFPRVHFCEYRGERCWERPKSGQ